MSASSKGRHVVAQYQRVLTTLRDLVNTRASMVSSLKQFQAAAQEIDSKQVQPIVPPDVHPEQSENIVPESDLQQLQHSIALEDPTFVRDEWRICHSNSDDLSTNVSNRIESKWVPLVFNPQFTMIYLLMLPT